MMSLFDLISLSLALGMDCLTVSIACGVIMVRIEGRTVLRMAVLFGFFQAMMPFLGWLASRLFNRYIEHFAHWVAFGCLVLIGCKMIHDAFEEHTEHHLDPRRLHVQFILAVATSIDALAVGVSLDCLGYHDWGDLAMPLTIIGVGSLLLSLLGSWLGVRFGSIVSQRLRPELLGGIILVLIGIKVLLA